MHIIRIDVNKVSDRTIPLTARSYRAKAERRKLAYARSFSGRRPDMPYTALWAEIKDEAFRYNSNGNPKGPSPDCFNSQGGTSTISSVFTATRKQQLMNKAYDRMVNRVQGERAQLGTALAEYKSATDMIVNRAGQLTRAYRNLRRGRFDLMLGDLHIRKALPKHHGMKWNRPKDASSLWLEYWFGWAPLISDIGTAIEILQDPPATFEKMHRVRVKEKFQYSFRQSGRNAQNMANGPIQLSCLYQLTSRVDNPNINLANRLGFTNPATIAWELVPFSFLVDWFYPVGRFLSSGDDWLGITRINPMYTLMYKAEIVSEYIDKTGSKFTNEVVQMDRYMGNIAFLPQPIWRRLSLTRAATSVSLLISVFSGKLR